VVRPFNAMMLSGGTDDPGDDILDPNYKVPDWDLLQLRDFRKSGFGITPATASRLQYPAMEIDRTVNITPYGTAAKGETLRYTVKITNRSSDPAYMEFCAAEQGCDYNGVDYVNLVVREKIPVGTKLNRALGKATVCGDEIIFNGKKYVGETQNGIPCGIGYLYETYEKMYKGTFCNGLPHGIGATYKLIDGKWTPYDYERDCTDTGYSYGSWGIFAEGEKMPGMTWEEFFDKYEPLKKV
jgi:hypothetical protein